MTIDPMRDRLVEALEWGGQAAGKIVEVETAKVPLVIFAIGPSLLALPARALTEILPLSPIHFVPGCPPVIEGVINVRGDVVSVIRLGGLLGLEHAPASRATAILWGRGQDRAGQSIDSGLRVDRVIDVLALPESAIQPPPESLAEPLRGLATGLFIHGEASVILLDLDAISNRLDLAEPRRRHRRRGRRPRMAEGLPSGRDAPAPLVRAVQGRSRPATAADLDAV